MVSAKGKLRSKVVIPNFHYRGAQNCSRLCRLAIMVISVIMADRRFQMVREVNAVNFRQNLGEMLNQVQYRNDSIIISKDGKPVAALVDAELFARIRRMYDRFDELSSRLAERYRDVPEEEGLTEIDTLVAEERKHR